MCSKAPSVAAPPSLPTVPPQVEGDAGREMYFIEAGEVQVIITVEDVNQVTAAWTDGSRTAVLAAQGSHRGRCEGRTRLTCSCHPESYAASTLPSRAAGRSIAEQW